ncbi:MAG TPA: hypothetical protein VFJ10_10945 [Acidobacteriaceae bacterium]|nr:hypothetical protein [Acidobacteriaceae bacterium]
MSLPRNDRYTGRIGAINCPAATPAEICGLVAGLGSTRGAKGGPNPGRIGPLAPAAPDSAPITSDGGSSFTIGGMIVGILERAISVLISISG